MYLFGFNLLPVIFFVPLLYIISLIIYFMKSTPMNMKFIVAGLFTGFFGFFLTVGIPLNSSYFYDYLLLPFSYAILFFVFSIICMVKNKNPFSPHDPLFKKEKKKPLAPPMTAFIQTKKEASDLVHLLLTRAKQPIEVAVDKSIPNGDDSIFFPFIAVTPKAIFTIFPCNWSGKIAYSKDTLVRYKKHSVDMFTNEVFDPFKEKVLTTYLEENNIKNIPIHKVVVATNPTAFFDPIKETDFSVVDLGDFSSFISEFYSSTSLSTEEMARIKSFFI